ncbi:hypothetical protein C8J57DRAFT_1346255 [Mycena rebaudengoi]|nr:hypothetical protein C8J57DRAFT_1346255 [Mycena rebaudengoi]
MRQKAVWHPICFKLWLGVEMYRWYSPEENETEADYIAPPDPTKIIRRRVLLYPANSDDPTFVQLDFGAGGPVLQSYGYEITSSVDLHPIFGDYTRDFTRLKTFNLEDLEDEPLDGDHRIFFNISQKLPLNRSVAKILGVDLSQPQMRPFWRGDLVVIKERVIDCPRPWTIAKDIEKSIPGSVKQFLKTWYDSVEWENFFQLGKQNHHVNTLMANAQIATVLNLMKNPNYITERDAKLDRQTRALDEVLKDVEKRREEYSQELPERSCATCGADKLPSASRCSGCHEVYYCSKICQKQDWKTHKTVCARKGSKLAK